MELLNLYLQEKIKQCPCQYLFQWLQADHKYLSSIANLVGTSGSPSGQQVVNNLNILIQMEESATDQGHGIVDEGQIFISISI